MSSKDPYSSQNFRGRPDRPPRPLPPQAYSAPDTRHMPYTQSRPAARGPRPAAATNQYGPRASRPYPPRGRSASSPPRLPQQAYHPGPGRPAPAPKRYALIGTAALVPILLLSVFYIIFRFHNGADQNTSEALLKNSLTAEHQTSENKTTAALTSAAASTSAASESSVPQSTAALTANGTTPAAAPPQPVAANPPAPVPNPDPAPVPVPAPAPQGLIGNYAAGIQVPATSPQVPPPAPVTAPVYLQETPPAPTTPQRTFYGQDLIGGRNQQVSFIIRGVPGMTYSISVINPSGKPSKAQGLYPKAADANGYVSWDWKIGGNANKGTGSIIISDNEGNRQTFAYIIQ